MAKNDIVLLDGILDQRMADSYPSRNADEVFEYLAFEQVLKDYDLSREEIESGWVDGRDDGGIDGFFTVVNGHLLRDPITFAWPKRSAMLDIVIITAKHHATFQQAPLNNLLATLPEFLDLSLERVDLKGAYSETLLKARGLFHAAYRRLAAITPTINFRFLYVSRGDRAQVGESVAGRGDQIVSVPASLFSSSTSAFEFVGAAELTSLYRRRKTFSLALPFLEYLSRSGDGYILLATLGAYSAFVTDENGHLRRYLFDSNVRDYLGENRVNEDISSSLAECSGPEFWWLNNGVTILATGATVLGKVIQLQDVQIVNGLQTTESIFMHFGASSISRDKALLVKVVVSTDTTVRDQIIRATNNQSTVEAQSLHATDKIQRDIEEMLERHGWFYERRKNYYRNIGKPPARFVTPMYVAAGFVALVHRNPTVAAGLKSRFMRNPEAYNAVFSEEIALEVWPAITEVLKRAEDTLEGVRPRGPRGERFLARSRNLLGLLAVARCLKGFSYTVDELVALDKSKLDREMLLDTWALVKEVRGREGHKRDDEIPAMDPVCVEAAVRFGLSGIEQVGRRKLPDFSKKYRPNRDILSAPFIEMVNRALPPQPWKPGIHLQVARQLNAKASKVSAAIQCLIIEGKRMEQRDGIVYDSQGTIVARDEDR